MRYNRFAGVQKRISTLTIAIVFFASSLASAAAPLLVSQFARAATTQVLSENFNTYSGNDEDAPPHWQFTDIDRYTTPASSGDAPNSIKFHRSTSKAIVDIPFTADQTANGLSFWLQRNGAGDGSSFFVHESSNGSDWNLLEQYDVKGIPANNAGQSVNLLLAANTTHLKFSYEKDKGNLAFDDVVITADETEDIVEELAPLDVPTLVAPADASTLNDTTVNFSWSPVDDATKYQIELSSSGDVQPDGGFASGIGVELGDITSYETADFTPIDGTYFWHIRAGDSGGNWSNWSPTRSLTIDSSAENDNDSAAPAQVEGLQIRKGHSATAPLLGCGGYTNSTQIRVEWDHSPESDIDYYWFGTKFNAKHAKVAADKNFYHGNMTPGNNPYYYTVIAVDTAGNESELSEQCGIILDTAAPLAKIISPGDGDFVSGIVALVGEVTDANPMNSYFRVEGPNSYVKTSLHTDGRSLHEFNWNTSGLDDGEYKIFFEARDKADNKDGSRSNPGDSVDVITVLIDRTSPVVDIENVQVSQDKKLSFDLSATDTGPAGLLHVAANIYNESNTGSPLITLGSGNPTRLNDPHSGLPLGTPLFNASPSNIDVSGLPTGTYTIRAFARDHAGNEHRFKLAYFVVDNTAPSVNAGDDDLVVGLAYGLNGIVSDNESGIASFVWSLLSSPAGETANFDDETALNTAVNVTGYGAYVFELTAIDNAGNVSADTVEITFEEPVETSGGGAVESVTTNTPNNISQFAANFFGNVFNNTADPGQDNQQNENIDENDAAETSGQVESESITQDTDEQGAAEAENTNTIAWYWILFVLLLALAAYYGYRNIRHSKDD